MKDINIFHYFRDLYNRQLKFHTDCELAFEDASKLFFIKFGYQPYHHIEDFLAELFRIHGGSQLLE